ncbi:MAG: hypothetical protein JW795_12320 [Chitinivibrionales bacterium]|nr:hypothetical protein [Chitinivibrionales bacterium]
MLSWIRRMAKICAGFGFVILLIAGLDFNDIFDETTLVTALVKASFGAFALWFVIFIICDIIFKGVISDVSQKQFDTLDGGIAQRIWNLKKEPSVDTIDNASHGKGSNEQKSGSRHTG